MLCKERTQLIIQILDGKRVIDRREELRAGWCQGAASAPWAEHAPQVHSGRSMWRQVRNHG